MQSSKWRSPASASPIRSALAGPDAATPTIRAKLATARIMPNNVGEIRRAPATCLLRVGGLIALVLGGHIQNGGAHGDLDIVLAIFHARVTPPVGIFRLGAIIDDEPVGIGHLDLVEILVAECEIILHNTVDIEDIGGDRADLVGVQ